MKVKITATPVLGLLLFSPAAAQQPVIQPNSSYRYCRSRRNRSNAKCPDVWAEERELCNWDINATRRFPLSEG